MGYIIIRALFILISGAAGYELFLNLGISSSPLLGTGVAVLVALLIVIIEQRWEEVPLQGFLWGSCGFSLGLVTAMLLNYSPLLPVTPTGINFMVTQSIRVFVALLFPYIGTIVALKMREKFNFQTPWSMFQEKSRVEFKVLDTSVIIDGRIADICETGFLEGVIVIPQFILHELQGIADSPDPLKRKRGRRGMEILHRIQKMTDIQVKIDDRDYANIKEVDAKLVKFAEEVKGKILTNDFNLNKIAELQGVTVLNINDLANALKPVVLPGETLKVRVVKEGKEYNQGVAYLDDGTMVVVDNGRKNLGQILEVTVTSVLQTTAGRMIFTKLENSNTNNGYEKEPIVKRA